MAKSNNLSLQRSDKIKALLNDFLKLFPNNSRSDLVELKTRLDLLSDDEISLLFSQLEAEK